MTLERPIHMKLQNNSKLWMLYGHWKINVQLTPQMPNNSKNTLRPTQKGEIGSSLVTEWFEPSDESRDAREAAERALDFLTGWMLEPLVFGELSIHHEGFGGRCAPSSEVFVYPQGLGHALEYITKEYNKPKVYITENGYPQARDDSIPIETTLQDDARIQHILTHLRVVSEALKKGVNFKSYFMWSLMDCLEMGSAYNVRYGPCGLYYTDYNTLDRIPKKQNNDDDYISDEDFDIDPVPIRYFNNGVEVDDSDWHYPSP
nr:beta-glucosidase 13-like [Coffea arabica]